LCFGTSMLVHQATFDLEQPIGQSPSRALKFAQSQPMPNNHTSEASRSAQSRRGRDHYNQSARASVPRPNGRHPNSVPLNNFGNHFPAAAPSNKDHFSFETVSKAVSASTLS